MINIILNLTLAQHFGVPQRRRRVFLVASFTGKDSGEILFKPKSLCGYLTARRTTRENAPESVAGGTNTAITTRNTTGTLRAKAGAPKHESDWGNLVLCKGFDGYNANLTDETSSTLGINCGMSTGRNGVIEILNDQGGNSLSVEKSEKSPTLRAQTHGNLPVVAHPAVTGTLTASAAGLNRPGGQAAETDLCVVEPAYAIQGMIIGRQDSNGPRGFGVAENTCYTLTATDKHATCYAESGFAGFREGIGTLTACGGSNGGGSESLVVTPPPKYTVRRLTPVECERLQGYPDDWTKYGDDSKEISDSKRYMMLGNSVAVPCVAYIFQGIIEETEGKNIE